MPAITTREPASTPATIRTSLPLLSGVLVISGVHSLADGQKVRIDQEAKP